MRRINSKTGKEFQRGDVREDGYIFIRYLIKRPIKKDGFVREEWLNPKRKEYGQKRLDLRTGKPFKKGAYNKNRTKQFWDYVVKSNDKEGFCYENWYRPEKYEAAIKQERSHSNRYKGEMKALSISGDLKKRLNPSTKREFKSGERDEFGRYFLTYTRNSRTRSGYIGEYWGDENAFLRRQIHSIRQNAKNRAKINGVDFTVTTDFLEKIFPQDYVCPVLGIKMEWLGNVNNSPSLDRIIPKFGYIENNVAWISWRANVLKLHRTPAVLRKIAEWIENELSQRKRQQNGP
jgi:hypothetical protein